MILFAAFLAAVALIATLVNLVLFTDAGIIIMILGLLAAEIVIYVLWRRPRRSGFEGQLNSLSIYLIIYAVIIQFSNGWLYLVVVVVALLAWQRLYVEAGGMSWRDHPQRLTLLIFVRLLIRPVLGGLFLLLELFSSPGSPLLLINLATAVVLLVICQEERWYSLQS